jgi:hypothetical protein
MGTEQQVSHGTLPRQCPMGQEPRRWDSGTSGTVETRDEWDMGRMSDRKRLPNRRGHELLDFEHGGLRYTAGIGRFEDGRLAEIFLNTRKHGTGLDTSARDASIAASLLLQHGCPLETLRRALTRNADGSASGPLARALDLLVPP